MVDGDALVGTIAIPQGTNLQSQVELDGGVQSESLQVGKQQVAAIVNVGEAGVKADQVGIDDDLITDGGLDLSGVNVDFNDLVLPQGFSFASFWNVTNYY